MREETFTAFAAGGQAPLLYRALDRVIDEVSGHEHDDELKAARAEFEERRGRIFQDEALWEEWTQGFLEWFAVERPWRGGATPVVRALAEVDGRERDALQAWSSSQRLLAEIRALERGRVELVDLLGGAAFAVMEPRVLHGVVAGDLVEVRVIGFEEQVRFGRTFVYHPRGARTAILALLDAAASGDHGRVLDELAGLRVRVERYRHVDPARVYEAEANERAGGRTPASG